MGDATGHMDRPGAGPFSTNEFVDGVPANYYTHENPETGKIEVVTVKPDGSSGFGRERVRRSRNCSTLDPG
jgi:hypothetical protein